MNKNVNGLAELWQHSIQRAKNFYQSKAFYAMFWVLLGNGGQQIIRFGGNLILTRILFPEAFGIMAIVTAIIVGIDQLSDVGIRQGVINSKRVNDPKFMQTAWTLQVLKGLLIALITSIIAWPASQFYGEPLLFPIIIVTGIATFALGFKSIALLAYDKRLDLKTQVKSSIATQVIGLTTMITLAIMWQSVWALVVGNSVSIFIEVLLSYKLFKGHFSRFKLEEETVSYIINFGKWILVSSAIAFLSLNGSALIIGIFLSIGELGVYSIAAGLASISALLASDLSVRVLHPLFKESIEKNNNYETVKNYRLLFNISFTFICIVLALFGDQVIKILYSDQYKEAGWMLQLIAIGQIGMALSISITPFLLAKEDSFSQMTSSIVRSTLMVTLIIIGGTFYGTLGVIVGHSITNLLVHPIMIFLASKHGYYCGLQDILIMISSILFVIFFWINHDMAISEKLISTGWL